MPLLLSQCLRDQSPLPPQAYSVVDPPSGHSLFGRPHFVECCERAANAGRLSHGELCQLHQWNLWLTERGEAWPRLSLGLSERCRLAFCIGKGVPSKMQRQVHSALAALGLEPLEEVRTEQGYSLDAVVELDGRDVAVEFDGPSHFVGQTEAPTGSTMLKRRQLHAAGWPLLVVPYWEWNELDNGGDKARVDEYLMGGLREAIAMADKSRLEQ